MVGILLGEKWEGGDGVEEGLVVDDGDGGAKDWDEVDGMDGRGGESRIRLEVEGGKGSGEKWKLVALKDTGSSHSFVDAKVVEEMGWRMEDVGYVVRGIGGSLVVEKEVVVPWEWNGWEGGKVSCGVIKGMRRNLGVDVILGRPWLKEVGLWTEKGGEGQGVEVLVVDVQRGSVMEDGKGGEARDDPKWNAMRDATVGRQRSFKVATKLGEFSVVVKDGAKFSNWFGRGIPFEFQAAFEETLKKWLADGVVEERPSKDGLLVAPMVAVQEPTKIRFCYNAASVNKAIVLDPCSPPSLDDIRRRSLGWKWFSQLDLPSAYHLIPIREGDRNYFGFAHRGRFFRFARMQFGIRSAAEFMQRALQEVLKEFAADEVIHYSDDILVGGATQQECWNRTERVLAALAQHTIPISIEKSSFGVRSVVFVGWRLEDGTVRKDPKLVEDVLAIQKPLTKVKLRSLIGKLSWFRAFVPNFAAVAAPLTALTAKDVSTRILWTLVEEEAFSWLKEAIADATYLVTPAPSDKLRITTDASDTGLAALLECSSNGVVWLPVAFASKKLEARFSKWSPTWKEAHAFCWGIGYFRKWIMGRPILARTDHLPAIDILNDPSNEKFYRWFVDLGEYDLTV